MSVSFSVASCIIIYFYIILRRPKDPDPVLGPDPVGPDPFEILRLRIRIRWIRVQMYRIRIRRIRIWTRRIRLIYEIKLAESVGSGCIRIRIQPIQRTLWSQSYYDCMWVGLGLRVKMSVAFAIYCVTLYYIMIVCGLDWVWG